jgi:alpha-ketoglutarate-dependent taurine dioxygenase
MSESDLVERKSPASSGAGRPAAGRPGFAVTDLTPLIGSRIETDASTLLSGRFASDIRNLLAERGVLVFPGIGFDDETQIAFTRTLGTQAYENNGVPQADGSKQAIFKVSLDSAVNPIGEYLRTSFFWHLDGTMHEVPILASILSARYIPPEGGATEWCNTYAAYDALSESDKHSLEGLRVLHANWALQRFVNPEPTYEVFSAARMVPAREQPLVWRHRSGRRSLVIGSTAAYVVGMAPPDSMDLLVRLRDWATRPQFVVRHDWEVGDTVIWDNTGTLHRALPYEADSGRLLHRTMLQGEEPIA